MKRLLVVFTLFSIVLISGCVNDDVTGNIILEDEKFDITYTGGTCRQDTDCIVASCRDVSEDKTCMTTVEMLTELRCQDTGGIVSEKLYDMCGCVEGICSSK